MERLAVAGREVLSQDLTAKTLSENIDNFMTDSVTKNLEVENCVAEKLGMLSNIEIQLQLRERLECLNPSLKPFFRGKKAIVLAGITAITKLITHEKNGNTVTLAEEFDRMLEQEGLTKHISLYKGRRFTKLGYSAASVLQALPQITKLLVETWKSNLLIEACKLYINYEPFTTELHLLAIFTHKVTLPFLNCIEKATQEELLKIFPKLHFDLLNHDTLQDFKVNYKHVTIPALATEAEKEVINRMCVEVAKGFELQCGREYGFGISELSSHQTTELHKLQPEELKSMPTNNIIFEHLLATFSHCADVSKFRNKNFSAKGMKDNIVLHQTHQSTVLSITKTVQKLLSWRHHLWTLAQKKK